MNQPIPTDFIQHHLGRKTRWHKNVQPWSKSGSSGKWPWREPWCAGSPWGCNQSRCLLELVNDHLRCQQNRSWPPKTSYTFQNPVEICRAYAMEHFPCSKFTYCRYGNHNGFTFGTNSNNEVFNGFHVFRVFMFF